MYFGHKHVETGPHFSHEVATFRSMKRLQFYKILLHEKNIYFIDLLQNTCNSSSYS